MEEPGPSGPSGRAAPTAGDPRWELRDGGRLTVSALTADRLEPAARALCLAFAGSRMGKPIAVVRQVLESILAWQADRGALCLVGLLADGGGAAAAEEEVVAVTTLFLRPKLFPSEYRPSPPPDACYLSNMSVVPAHRGRGVARALLEAAELAGANEGAFRIALHVDKDDPVANGLYESAGYEPAGEAGFLAGLQNVGNPQRLLCKRVWRQIPE